MPDTLADLREARVAEMSAEVAKMRMALESIEAAALNLQNWTSRQVANTSAISIADWARAALDPAAPPPVPCECGAQLRDVSESCHRGRQLCHECDDIGCGDNVHRGHAALEGEK